MRHLASRGLWWFLKNLKTVFAENPEKSRRYTTIMKSHFTQKVIIVSLGIIGMITWIILFGLGVLVNSEPYRNAVLHLFSWHDFFLALITYTPTNLILLCLFAAFAGGCASKLIFSGITKKTEELGLTMPENKTDSQIYMNENPFGSMLRGLTVYFIFLTGSFLATTDPFLHPSADQYAKSAGTVSLLSFFVGYDPTVFRTVLSLTVKFKGKE